MNILNLLSYQIQQTINPNTILVKAIYNLDIAFLSFEIFAILSCLILLIFFSWISNKKNKKGYMYTSKHISNMIIASCIILITILNTSCNVEYSILNGYYVNDLTAFTFKNGSLVLFTIYMFLIRNNSIDRKIDFEFILMVYISFVCGLMLINVNDLFLLFLILEAQALCFYVVVCSRQNSSFSTEAGLKYFVLGSFSSGIILFGISLVYGFSGLLNYNDLSLFVSGLIESDYKFTVVQNSFVLGLLFVLFGLLFKLGAAPFHTWMPDVYEGSPLIITSYLATVAKIPIIFVFLKLIFQVMNPIFYIIQPLLICCGILSLLIGSIGALYQLKIKRLLTVQHDNQHWLYTPVYVFWWYRIDVNYRLLFSVLFNYVDRNIFLFRCVEDSSSWIGC